MCKKFIYLVAAFMVVGLIAPAAAQEVDMEIGYAVQPPVLDGEVDEIWADASTQYFVPLDDPADASGSWQVLYDFENLYVIVDVTDDSLQNDSASSWQDDSVEIYFDGGNTKLSTPLSGDDHQYTFGWTADDIQGTNIAGYTEGIEQAQVTTDTGWRIEVKMPWMSMQGVAPQPGDLIGIDCYYNDDDDGGDSREGKMLSFSTVEGWNDASQWGTAVLADVPGPVEPFQQIEADGIVLMEAEDYHNKTTGQSGSEWVQVGPTGGFTGEAGMQVADGTEGTNNTNYAAESPRLDYQITFVKTGTHYVWVRAWGPDGSGDSCHAGLDGQEIDTCDRMSGWNDNYRWSNSTMDDPPSTFEVATAGEHTLNIWMREDGLIVDKILLTTNPDYTPTGEGPIPYANQPVPADGAVDVDPGTLEWTAGITAVSHKVYLSTDETIDETDLIAETELTLVPVTLEPGTTYYWRVDEIDAEGVVYEGDVWTFTTIPLEAHFPDPADGAEDVALDAQLSWTPGKVVAMHDLYFSTDEAGVAAGDMSTFKAKLMQASYDPGPLEPFTTYYWRVDEFAPMGTVAGPVWSFSTVTYLTISDEETTLDYDNTIEPYVSEVAFDTPADMTYGGVTADLTLRFRGDYPAPPSSSFDAATGTYTVTSAGHDIWGNADEFAYVYRELTGDGSIMVRVTDNGTGSNAWAKGGVMIRQNLEQGSVNVMGAITGGSGDGGTFQWRENADDSSGSSRTLSGIAPPYWVRIARAGNEFVCQMSADGVTWELEGDNPHTVVMTDPVLIGLAVTSHQDNEPRTFTFDSLSITGNVTGEEKTANVGVPANDPGMLYVAVEDAAGVVGVVAHPDPAAVTIMDWTDWRIALSDFAGVDPTASAKLFVGVGDGTPDGTGTIRIDDIKLVKPIANLLGHGGFEDGPATPLNTWAPLTWSLYGNGSMEVVSEDPAEGSYCLKVTVPEATANIWDVGFKQGGHVYEAGKSYTLSAWMKSTSGPLEINMVTERDESPYDGYSRRVTITEEWAQYSVTTDVIPETVTPAAVTFHIGYAVGEFLVDDVMLYEN